MGGRLNPYRGCPGVCGEKSTFKGRGYERKGARKWRGSVKWRTNRDLSHSTAVDGCIGRVYIKVGNDKMCVKGGERKVKRVFNPLKLNRSY